MSEFNLWFSTGFTHIADWNAYDHILFLLALCGVYEPRQWKTVLVLVTAFTIGHSITLALSVSNILVIKSKYIEFLIPLTILATALLNLRPKDETTYQNKRLKYLMALCFGFIHGMGFSYLLKSLLGKSESILMPLFAFNLGLEAGQIIIVFGIFIISLFLATILKINNRHKNLFISVAISAIALLMLIERSTALFKN